MPGGGSVPRHVRDIVLAALAGSFGSDFLATLGSTLSTVVGPVPTRLPSVQVLDREMDYVFELDSGERLHLEFQDRVDGATIRRFLAYDALLLVRDGVRVHTAVVYTGAVNRAPDAFDFGSVHYSVQSIYLSTWDGEQTLAELRQRLGRLERTDAALLALVPLMRLGRPSMMAAASECIRLLEGVSSHTDRAILAGTVIGLCDRFLPTEAVRGLIALASTTTPFDARGRAEGRARGLVDVLHFRFPEVPAELAERLLAERDLQRLESLWQLALSATDLTEFCGRS